MRLRFSRDEAFATVVGLAMFSVCWPEPSNATFLFKEGLIDALQVDSHERLGGRCGVDKDHR